MTRLVQQQNEINRKEALLTRFSLYFTNYFRSMHENNYYLYFQLNQTFWLLYCSLVDTINDTCTSTVLIYANETKILHFMFLFSHMR